GRPAGIGERQRERRARRAAAHAGRDVHVDPGLGEGGTQVGAGRGAGDGRLPVPGSPEREERVVAPASALVRAESHGTQTTQISEMDADMREKKQPGRCRVVDRTLLRLMSTVLQRLANL